MSDFPILDLERDPPRVRRPWIGWLIGLGLGGVLGSMLSDASLFELIAGLWLLSSASLFTKSATSPPAG